MNFSIHAVSKNQISCFPNFSTIPIYFPSWLNCGRFLGDFWVKNGSLLGAFWVLFGFLRVEKDR